MAIFFMDVRNVNKATQSAVAKAAYISGDKLHSERDDKVKFYQREVSPESFILAPSHAPAFVYDREKLWNEAEKVERAYNARVAKEVVFALPVELSREKQIELTREYVQESFVEKGMVADVNIHFDKEQNPHAHVLLTVRPFDEKGNWGNKTKKEYVKNENGEFVLNENGTKQTKRIDLTEGWNDRNTIIEWRKKLAEIINEKYKENGIEQNVTHRSNVDAGKEELAKIRLKRTEFQVEEKHKEFCEKNNIPYEPVTEYGKINFEIDKINKNLKEINQEIETLKLEKVHLEVDENIIPTLLNIRKDNVINRNDELKNDYIFIAKRAKVDVEKISYSHISKVSIQLKNWERKLLGDMRELNAKVNRLEKMYSIAKNNSSLKEFGSDDSKFADYYKQSVEELKDQKVLLENQRQQLRTAKITLSRVEKNEYQILFNQFGSVYPEYKDIVKFKTVENGEIMFSAMGNFVENLQKEKLQSLEFEPLKHAETHKLLKSISDTLDNAKYVFPSYFALSKEIKTVKQELENAVSINSNSQTIENLSLRYYAKLEHFDYMVKEYKEIQTNMNEQLEKIYGTDLSELNIKAKQELLKEYHEKRVPQDLSKYLQNNPDYQQQLQNQNAGLLETMLSVAVLTAEENDKYKYDQKKKRNKYGFEKGR